MKTKTPATTRDEPALFGLLAEFETPGDLMEAANRVREAGYTRWDCYTPFPVHGLERAMGLRDTRLPWVVLGAGASGTGLALLMQWWMNAKDYPLIVAGKPLFSLPAQIPIIFEVTVLLAAISAFVGLFVFSGLPRFYHPTFRSRAFKRVTADRFFIAVEAEDPRFDGAETARLLESLGSRQIDRLEG